VDACCPDSFGLSPQYACAGGPGSEERDGHLQIRWNPQSTSVREADRGVVSIRDGETSRDFELDPAQLRAGMLTYARRSERVDVALRLHVPNQPEVKQVSTFVGYLAPAKPAAMPAAAPPARSSDEFAKQAAQIEEQASKTKKLEQTVDELRKQLAQRKRLENQAPDAPRK